MNVLQRLAEEKNPVRFTISRVLWALRISSFLTMQRRGYRLRFYPSSTSAMMWVNPGNSPQDENLFHRMLRPGDTVIDVGANIGALTLCASSIVGPSGRVVSVEAHPRTFSYLSGNIHLNGVTNVEAHNLAIGEAERNVSFTDQRADEQNLVSAVASELTVPMRRLDNLVGGDGPIELLKIDVEGYEKFVLDGAEGILGRTECIYFESWERHFHRFEYGCRDLFGQLEARGFHLLRVADEQALVPLTPDHVSESCEDLLAVRDPDRLSVRTGLPLHLAPRSACATN